MQKNKCIFEVPLEKQEFVDIICRLKDSTELVDKVDALFRNSRENLEFKNKKRETQRQKLRNKNCLE